MRNKIIIFTLLLIAAAGAEIFLDLTGKSQHEHAARKSFKQLNKLFDSHEHGEVITTSTNPEQVFFAVEKKFGKYVTEEYLKKVEHKIWAAMKDDPDFEKNPARITFFLVNKGEGFQFSQPEKIEHSSWLSKGSSVKGTKMYIRLDDDDPGWEESTSLTYVIMMKDGWKFKVDDIEE